MPIDKSTHLLIEKYLQINEDSFVHEHGGDYHLRDGIALYIIKNMCIKRGSFPFLEKEYIDQVNSINSNNIMMVDVGFTSLVPELEYAKEGYGYRVSLHSRAVDRADKTVHQILVAKSEFLQVLIEEIVLPAMNSLENIPNLSLNI